MAQSDHHRLEPLMSRLAAAVVAATSLAVFAPAAPAAAQPGELFLSEYVEGSSNNKALELANPTDATVDVGAAGYEVRMYFNGNSTPGLAIRLTGTVAPGDVFVLAHSSAAPEVQAEADQTNGAGWFKIGRAHV